MQSFLIAFLALMGASPALSRAPQAADFAGADTVRAQIVAMEAAMKPGQGFAWKPLVQADGSIAAIEIWKKPGRPAIHPGEAEYAIVLAGEGELVSGGTMSEPEITNPGLTQGKQIIGGSTRTLRAGDVMIIPAGTPHWFGIKGDQLVLLGVKLPQTTK